MDGVGWSNGWMDDTSDGNWGPKSPLYELDITLSLYMLWWAPLITPALFLLLCFDDGREH